MDLIGSILLFKRSGIRLIILYENQYAKRYAERTNVIVLDPDFAELFPDSRSLNEALKSGKRLIISCE